MSSEDKDETIKDGVDESHAAKHEAIVKLEEVDVKSGEEDENELLKLRAKLYRFDKEWKERGTGDVKFLKHKETGKVRLLMRRDKTHKVCLNQYVDPETELLSNAGSDKSWQWKCVDFAEDEASAEVLCIKFRNVDDAKAFKSKYDEVKATNKATEERDAKAEAEAEAETKTKEEEKKAEADVKTEEKEGKKD